MTKKSISVGDSVVVTIKKRTDGLLFPVRYESQYEKGVVIGKKRMRETHYDTIYRMFRRDKKVERTISYTEYAVKYGTEMFPRFEKVTADKLTLIEGGENAKK